MRLPSFPLLTVLSFSACYSGPTLEPDDDGSSSATTPADGSDADSEASSGAPPDSSTTGPAPTTTGDGSAGSDDTGTTLGDDSTGEPPTEPGIHWVGRYDDSNPAQIRMGWSNAGLVARFDGTGATVRMDDPSHYFTVVVDGMVQPTLSTSPGVQDYVVASGLPAGEHTLELYRRTEGSFGPTVVHDVIIEGELLAPPPVTRRMEIIGDSITAGYGNEGVDPCGFTAETENAYLTYGAVAARTVGAELHMVAWSGKGMVYNYGEDTFQPMPELYERTIATEDAAWGFEWQPDAVVINLGTNDFSTDGDPPAELYVGTYVEFVAGVRERYPGAFILLLQPTLFGAEAEMVQGYLQDVVAQRNAAGDAAIAYADVNVEWIGSGCNGHPSVATHAGMAGRLVEELQTHLGW